MTYSYTTLWDVTIVGTPKHPVSVNTHAVHTSPLNDLTNTIDEGSVIPIVSDNTRPFQRYLHQGP